MASKIPATAVRVPDSANPSAELTSQRTDVAVFPRNNACGATGKVIQPSAQLEATNLPELTREDIGDRLRELRENEWGGLSIGRIAAHAKVSAKSWKLIEQGQLGPTIGSSTKAKRGAVRTTVRVLSFYVTHAKFPTFSVEQGLRALNFDPSNADVKAMLHDSSVASAISIKEGVPKIGTAAGRLALHKTVNVGIGQIGPRPRGSENPEYAWSWPLVRTIIGMAGAGNNLPAVAAPVPSYIENYDQAVRKLLEGGDVQVLFGIADTPARRQRGTISVNLPGLSFCLGLLCSPDIVGGWNFFIDMLLSKDNLDLPYLFSINNEVGFEFISSHCRSDPSRSDTVQNVNVEGGNFDELADRIFNLRLQGEKVAFVGDPWQCDQLHKKLRSLSKAVQTGRLNHLFEFTLYTSGTLSDVDKSPSQAPFPVPRFKSGFMLNKNDELASLLHDCLAGSLFSVFSAALATQYVMLLTESMFLRPWEGQPEGVQQIVLEPLPHNLSVLDKQMFANACLGGIRKLRERRQIDERLFTAIQREMECAWNIE